MRIRVGVALPLACMLCVPVVASAQQRQSLFEDSHPAIVADEVLHARSNVLPQQDPQQGEEMKPDEQMSASGFFLGIVSMLGGAAIGSAMGQSSCPAKTIDKDCMSRYGYTGALIAGSIAVPVGVHLVASHRRNLIPSVAISAAAATALYYGMRAIPGKPIALAPFIALPLQVMTAVKLERTKTP